MPIGPGSRIGPYEITALLGEGGMGTVWRARHLALKRDDALKVLPDAWAADPARLARFRQEAELLASLNHPHIAQVYGFEQAAGSGALVMELVDGPTLADRLVRGPLPPDEALSIARQIAEALDAAHERGIIHRDLKPANIKVRPDGTVKVLDFGLAKVIDTLATSEGEDPTRSIADLPQLTSAGIVMGTPAYMSPEQARGGRVDRRTDIWAFGCVLYEMLTGGRAFEGAGATETLAAVLAGSPDWSRLPAAVPAPMRRLLHRCLEMDLRRRPRHISAALLMLEEQDAMASGAHPTATAARATSRVRVGVAIAALAVAAAGGATTTWLLPRSAPPAVIRTTIPADTLVTGSDRSFAWLPDGRLVYLSRDAQQILIRPRDALDAVPVFTTAGYIRGLFPSPDGRWIGFVEGSFTLKKVPVGGGPAVTILQMDGPSRGVAWGPDDRIVFATAASGTGLQQVSAGGGLPTVLTRPDTARGESDHLQPVWLPDGRGLLFTVRLQREGAAVTDVAVLESGSASWRSLLQNAYNARCVDRSYLAYAAAGALWAVRFDLDRLAVLGGPVEVLSNAPVGSFGFAAHFDVSLDGMLVYPRDAASDGDPRVLVWIDRDGRETPLAAPPASYGHPRLSPMDGRRLAVQVSGDLFVWQIDQPWASASRLTFYPGIDWFPVWTPNGQRIIFGSWRGGGLSNLYVQKLDGTEAQRLTESPDMQLPTSIAPDGSTLVFHSYLRSINALRLDVTGEGRHITVLDTPLEERNGVISPDGRWLAYEAESATRSGQLDVFVRPFPDVARGPWQVTTGGGVYPLWAPRAGELFYMKLDGTLVAVPIDTTGPVPRVGSSVDLFRGPYFFSGDGSLARQYDVAPDGRRFLLLKNTVETRAPHFVVVQNWNVELARLTAGR